MTHNKFCLIFQYLKIYLFQDSLTCLTHISNGGSKQISLIVDSNGASTLSKLVHDNPFDQSVRCSSLKLLCHLIMYRELPKVTKQLNPTIINQLQKEVNRKIECKKLQDFLLSLLQNNKAMFSVLKLQENAFF